MIITNYCAHVMVGNIMTCTNLCVQGTWILAAEKIGLSPTHRGWALTTGALTCRCDYCNYY